MSNLRLIYDNKIPNADALSASSQKTGLATLPVKEGTGEATMDTQGDYAESEEKVYVVEIDSVSSGYEIGQATFRWSDDGGATWDASGITTTASWYSLNSGVQIKWTGATGHDCELGDKWTFRGVNHFGAGKMLDWNRDTRYRSASVDLGSELVTNGNFDSDISGWNSDPAHPYETFEWQSGKLHAANTSNDALGGSDDNISVVSGKLYKIAFDVSVSSGQNPTILMVASLNGPARYNVGDCGTGTHTFYWKPAITEDVVFEFYSSQAADFTLDNVSIKGATTYLYIDLGPGQEVKALILYDHNISEGALITILAYPTSDLDYPDLQEEVTWNDSKILHYLSSATTKRYWRLIICNPSNPDNYIEIAELFLGAYDEPADNIDMRYNRSQNALLAPARSDYGVRKRRYYNQAQVWRFRHSLIGTGDQDIWRNMFAAIMDRDAGTIQPIYFNLDPSTPSEFYMADLEALPQDRFFSSTWNITEIVLTEVLRSV